MQSIILIAPPRSACVGINSHRLLAALWLLYATERALGGGVIGALGGAGIGALASGGAAVGAAAGGLVGIATTPVPRYSRRHHY
jgi:hypothetical protein